MQLSKLKDKIPFKWRIGQVYQDKGKASCLAYIDARDVMDMLDKVCGEGNWQDKYEMIGDNLVCSIGIRVEREQFARNSSQELIFVDDVDDPIKETVYEWVWKSDTGTSGNFEAEKSIYSDAFKRAGVKWGIGRFLYDMKTEWVDINQYKQPVYPHNKERIYDLTSYINSKAKYEPKTR